MSPFHSSKLTRLKRVTVREISPHSFTVSILDRREENREKDGGKRKKILFNSVQEVIKYLLRSILPSLSSSSLSSLKLSSRYVSCFQSIKEETPSLTLSHYFTISL